MIRMKLQDFAHIKNLDFDIAKRRLKVYHEHEDEELLSSLATLNLDSRLLHTQPVSSQEVPAFERSEKQQARLLWTVLVINALFFMIEMAAGWWSGSLSLVADSLDMLADAVVYGLSIMAIGAVLRFKQLTAKVAGYLQMALAFLGLIEVLRRFFWAESIPQFDWMIGIAFAALLANVFCLYLLRGSQSKKELHMQASLIFTANDVIINLGVIGSALLVAYFKSAWPDLIMGTLVFVLVWRGAKRILNLAQ